MNLEELAGRIGTPVYVYSEKTIRQNFRRLDQALQALDHMICYAVKASSNIAILSLLNKEGAARHCFRWGNLPVLKAEGVHNAVPLRASARPRRKSRLR